MIFPYLYELLPPPCMTTLITHATAACVHIQPFMIYCCWAKDSSAANAISASTFPLLLVAAAQQQVVYKK